jgi:hypothetical protein
VLQAPAFDGLSLDPFSLQQDGLAAPEVDVGRGEIVEALMVSPALSTIARMISRSFCTMAKSSLCKATRANVRISTKASLWV